LIIALSLSLVVWLYEGIAIERLKLYNVNIKGLYLKLDKKLILKANNVVIEHSKKPLKVSSIDKIFDRMKYGFRFFEFIQLKSVNFKNNHYYLTYVNSVLHIVSDEYESVVDIKRTDEKLHADISLLYIKKEDITLSGKLIYNMRSGDINAKGSYRAYDLQGAFTLDKLAQKVSLKLDANKTTSIDKVINRFIKNPKTNAWILQRIKAKKYWLDELSAKGEIVNGEFQLDVDSIYGLLHARDIDVYFNKNLAHPVDVKKLKLIYQKGALIFNLGSPSYQDKNITHGKVTIEGLDNHKPYLHLDLDLTSRFDKKILGILNAYKLNIPLLQSSGETNASLYIGVNLKNSKVKFLGDFNLSKGILKIKDAPLAIDYGEVSYANKIVSIKKAHLHNALYKGKVKGEVDVRAKRVELDVDLDYFRVAKKRKKIVNITKMKFPLTLHYAKGVRCEIPSLHTKIYQEKSNTVIDLANIAKIKSYIPALPSMVDGGKVKLYTKNFKEFRLSGYATWKECFLYSKKGVCHTRLPLSATIKKGHLKLDLFGKKIKFSSYNDTIYVNGMHIDLDKLIKSKEKKHTHSEHKPKKVTIFGKDSIISYKKYRLLTNHYSIDIYRNRLLFSSVEGKRKLKLTLRKNNKQLSIDAQNIDDKMLHPLINFKSLKGGKYSLLMQGEISKKMKGKITIDGGMVEKFQGYNNLVAFFNAIPALMTLSNPGFDAKGYRIEKGEIEYELYNQNLIKFKSIKIVGGSSTIIGAGEINLAKNSIKIDLAVQTAREIGKVVGAIPIVGYILVGDGKSIGMGIKVRGTLDNPKIESQAIKDMVSLPLGMIDRLFKSPKRLLDNVKKANSNP